MLGFEKLTRKPQASFQKRNAGVDVSLFELMLEIMFQKEQLKTSSRNKSSTEKSPPKRTKGRESPLQALLAVVPPQQPHLCVGQLNLFGQRCEFLDVHGVVKAAIHYLKSCT